MNWGVGHLLQLFHLGFGDVQVAQAFQHQGLGVIGGVEQGPAQHAGHDNHLVEQALGLGDLPQHGDFPAAAGLAEDGHVVRVAAKAGDVVPHPAQGLHQVGHAHVYGVPILLPKGGQVQVAKGV